MGTIEKFPPLFVSWISKKKLMLSYLGKRTVWWITSVAASHLMLPMLMIGWKIVVIYVVVVGEIQSQ